MNSNAKKHATGKRFLFLAAALVAMMFTFTQCDKISELFDKPTKPTSSCDQKVIICNTQFENAPNYPISIMNMEIVGDCLKIKFGASGCDIKNIKLIDSDNVYFFYTQHYLHPPERYVRLSFDNPGLCARWITEEVSFNIKDLRVQGRNKIWLRLSDIPEDVILYKY